MVAWGDSRDSGIGVPIFGKIRPIIPENAGIGFPQRMDYEFTGWDTGSTKYGKD